MMMNKKLFSMMLVLILVVTGCSITKVPAPTTTAVTAPISTPTLAPTLTPTYTPTITFTPTPAPISALNAKALVPLQTFQGNEAGFGWLPAFAFSPDLKRYVASNNEHSLVLYDAATGKVLNILEGNTSQIWWATFAPDGKTLAASDDQGNIVIWDASTGNKIYQLSGYSSSIFQFAYSPDGKMIGAVTNTIDQTLILWDAEHGKYIRTLLCLAVCDAIAFSPDNQVFATDSEGKYGEYHNIILRDMTGKPIRTLSENIETIIALAFSPDGSTLASEDQLGVIILWNVESGQKLSQFDPSTGKTGMNSLDRAYSLAFSPDGRSLASGYSDGSLIVWDVASASPIFVHLGTSSQITDPAGRLTVNFSADGRFLVSTQRDNSGIVWGLSTSPYHEPSPSPKPSVVILEEKGSYPDQAHWSGTINNYPKSLKTGVYNILITTDDDTRLCHLVWQVRSASADPNSPAPWFGESNIVQSFEIKQEGDYVIIVFPSYMPGRCQQSFTYAFTVFQP